MRTHRLASVCLVAGLLTLLLAPARAAEPIPPPRAKGWLGLARLTRGARVPFNPSPVFERYLWRADAAPPKAGETLRGPAGKEASWQPLTPDEKGTLDGRGLAIAYAAVQATREQAKVWIAIVKGASVLYVNGEPIGGDPYAHGITRLPVKIRKGTNHIYVAGLRGACEVEFTYAHRSPSFPREDATLPELVPGRHVGVSAGVLVLNPSEETLADLVISGTILVSGEGMKSVRFPLHAKHPVSIPPLGTLKVALLQRDQEIPPGAKEGWLAVVAKQGDRVLENTAWKLPVRSSDEAYRTTFRSTIDGSVQFYALRPPVGGTDGGMPVLTLHGASVDAWNQARAYSAREGVWIIAPTNRRPFGFDWQDWGRQDAYEVMDVASRRYALPPRFFLTGHSMGGHGTWHLAVNDPDRFRAIAPSAGWSSFDSYGGGRPEGARTAVWRGADGASQTDALLENLRDTPIYVLHGTKDDNVPVREAQQLVAKLRSHGIEPEVHYAEGEGHWWDGDAAPGADCVDWPPIFEMFARDAEPTPTDPMAWTTADVGVDAEHHGWRIEQPLSYGAPSSLTIRHDDATHATTVETKNVRRLVRVLVNPRHRREPPLRALDGQAVTCPSGSSGSMPTGLAYERDPDTGVWAPAALVTDVAQKNPGRMGPFKRAFDNRFVLVYGTAGHGDEDAALLASARYDAEQWRYRANGRAECVTDAHFLAHPDRYRDRNVVLYGNTTTNAAWDAVLDARCPIHAERGGIRAAGKTWKGEALGLLLVYPRKGSDVAQVGVVGDTGVLGTRLGFRLPYFVSGVGIPDYVIYGPEVLRQGDEGVRAAGFFDHAWELKH